MTSDDQISVATIRADDIDFSDATPVISGTQKFVVPVPAFTGGGEPLVVPDGEIGAGQPIVDWQGQPVGERGIVFWNAKDQCWQAAVADGTAVVLLNEVSEEQARSLHEKFLALGGGTIALSGLKQFLSFAESIGLTDCYNSDITFVRDCLTPVQQESLQFEYGGVTMGFVKRGERDIARAVYLERPFEFSGSDGICQKMPYGGAIVRLGENVRAVQPDVFRRTYRLAADGRKIDDPAGVVKAHAIAVSDVGS